MYKKHDVFRFRPYCNRYEDFSVSLSPLLSNPHPDLTLLSPAPPVSSLYSFFFVSLLKNATNLFESHFYLCVYVWLPYVCMRMHMCVDASEARESVVFPYRWLEAI